MERIQVNHKDFWHIRMRPASIVWHHVIQRMLDSVKIEAWNDWIRTTHDETGDHLYLVSKERYDASKVAGTFGISPETLQGIAEIVLDEPEEGDLPKPTVDYTGEA